MSGEKSNDEKYKNNKILGFTEPFNDRFNALWQYY